MQSCSISPTPAAPSSKSQCSPSGWVGEIPGFLCVCALQVSWWHSNINIPKSPAGMKSGECGLGFNSVLSFTSLCHSRTPPEILLGEHPGGRRDPSVEASEFPVFSIWRRGCFRPTSPPWTTQDNPGSNSKAPNTGKKIKNDKKIPWITKEVGKNPFG